MLPSPSLITNARSITRMVPASTSSCNAGTISPLNWLPGNATIMYSTGPIPIRFPFRREGAKSLMARASRPEYRPAGRQPHPPNRMNNP